MDIGPWKLAVNFENAQIVIALTQKVYQKNCWFININLYISPESLYLFRMRQFDESNFSQHKFIIALSEKGILLQGCSGLTGQGGPGPPNFLGFY